MASADDKNLDRDVAQARFSVATSNLAGIECTMIELYHMICMIQKKMTKLLTHLIEALDTVVFRPCDEDYIMSNYSQEKYRNEVRSAPAPLSEQSELLKKMFKRWSAAETFLVLNPIHIQVKQLVNFLEKGYADQTGGPGNFDKLLRRFYRRSYGRDFDAAFELLRAEHVIICEDRVPMPPNPTKEIFDIHQLDFTAKINALYEIFTDAREKWMTLTQEKSG